MNLDHPTNGELQEKSVKFRYPEFYKFLKAKYKHIKYTKFCELLYLYKHNLTEQPRCKCCNNPVKFENFNHGYHTYCSIQCQGSDPDIKKKILDAKIEKYGKDNITNHKKTVQTNLERYGVENPMQVNAFKKSLFEHKKEKYGSGTWNNRELAKKTCKNKYGVEHVMQVEEIAKKSMNTRIEKYGKDNITNHKKTVQTNLERYGVQCTFMDEQVKEKIRNSNIERYGVEYPMQSEKIREKSRQTSLEKYGVDIPAKSDIVKNKAIETNLNKYGCKNNSMTQEWKSHIKKITPQIQEKVYNTKKRNNTFNSSSIEEQFKQWLIENNITFKRQYKSNEYPFACDFYFPNNNLYLEIQGYWSHGKHPFNPNDPKDIETVNNWRERGTKQYLENIETWTIRDPQKRQWAKDHNLNWKEIFTCDLDELLVQIKDDII